MIQRIIKKCSVYYSAYGSAFSVLSKYLGYCSAPGSGLKTHFFPSFGRPPSHDQPQYTVLITHIKGLSDLSGNEVIIRMLSLPWWGPVRGNSCN